MQELIEAIRAAAADGATAEQKAVGAQACRTILAALGAERGKPLVLPGAPAPSPLAGVSVEQALDLLITRLGAIAEAREAAPPPAALPEAHGPRIALIPVPARGVRLAPRNGGPRRK